MITPRATFKKILATAFANENVKDNFFIHTVDIKDYTRFFDTFPKSLLSKKYQEILTKEFCIILSKLKDNFIKRGYDDKEKISDFTDVDKTLTIEIQNNICKLINFIILNACDALFDETGKMYEDIASLMKLDVNVVSQPQQRWEIVCAFVGAVIQDLVKDLSQYSIDNDLSLPMAAFFNFINTADKKSYGNLAETMLRKRYDDLVKNKTNSSHDYTTDCLLIGTGVGLFTAAILVGGITMYSNRQSLSSDVADNVRLPRFS